MMIYGRVSGVYIIGRLALLVPAHEYLTQENRTETGRPEKKEKRTKYCIFIPDGWLRTCVLGAPMHAGGMDKTHR